MIALLVFNFAMVLLGIGIATRIVPERLYTGLLDALHITVGITTPPPQKLRQVVLIWLATILFLVDGLLFLLVFLTFQLR
jgi:hypothetical protein